MKKLGLIVNPVAGVGGRVGLKGSDGAEILRAGARARRRARRAAARAPGARAPRARARPRRGPHLAGRDGRGRGPGGRVRADACSARSPAAAPTSLCELERGRRRAVRIACDDFVLTTPDDTEQAARDLLAAGVDLILFAGGDGTARNICNALGDRVPVIGVPAGVKIHSAVYATTPAAAGDVAALYLHDRPAPSGCASARSWTSTRRPSARTASPRTSTAS